MSGAPAMRTSRRAAFELPTGLVMDIGGHLRVLLGVDHNFEVIQLRHDLRLSPVRFGLVRKRAASDPIAVVQAPAMQRQR